MSFYLVPAPLVSISIPGGTLYHGDNTTLTCTVNTTEIMHTTLNVTISWFGPSGPLTSDNEHTVSPATQLLNTPTYTSTLFIVSLSIERDNGMTYRCTAAALPCLIDSESGSGSGISSSIDSNNIPSMLKHLCSSSIFYLLFYAWYCQCRGSGL